MPTNELASALREEFEWRREAVASIAQVVAGMVALSATEQLMLLAYAANELYSWFDRDFADACANDENCWNTWIEILRTEAELNNPLRPLREEVERLRREEIEVIQELRSKLREIGADIECSLDPEDECEICYRDWCWRISEFYFKAYR